MPIIGFGTWQIKNQKECVESVTDALDAGYKHIDTAQIYGNEQYVGEAIAKSNIKREDLFITTKISIHNFLRVNKSFKDSLEKLGTEYVDLLLLHFPVIGARKKAWKDLEKIYENSQAKSIGVSNYTIKHLKDMEKYWKVVPAVNQVELHVYLQQPELLEYCLKKGIVVEAYSPLAHAHDFDNEVLMHIAKKHSKTTAQIMLRWCIEKGTVPLPKSANTSRINENIEIFDFKLDSQDMDKLKDLDEDLRTCWDPTKAP